MASSRKIVTHESEVALSNYFPRVTVNSFELIGFGISHAFGEYFKNINPNLFEMDFERLCLTGQSELIDGSIPPFRKTKYAENFKNHLKKLHSIKSELPRKQWMDVLHAIALADVITPFSNVMKQNNLSPENIENLGKDKLSNLLKSMPSRAMDIHLSHQVLKKNDYNPKITDLEDWAGIGKGAQYCDVVVCEKHFADMLLRDGFQPKAKILRNIIDLENTIP